MARVFSESHRANLSAAAMGRVVSAETIAKRLSTRLATTSAPGYINPNIGKKHTEERKANNSKARTGQKMPPITDEHRKNLRIASRKRFERDGHYLDNYFEGIRYQGNWEKRFIKYCLNNSWDIRRCTQNECLEYEYNGTHTYEPDFSISKDGQQYIVEIKGYESGKDRAKKLAAERKFGERYLYFNTDHSFTKKHLSIKE